MRRPSPPIGIALATLAGLLPPPARAAGHGALEFRNPGLTLSEVQLPLTASLLLHEPLIPGAGQDNTLTWAGLGVTREPTTAQIEAAAWNALASYLDRAQALRVDRAELGTPRVTVHEGGQLVQIYVPRTFGGVPVRDSSLAAVIGHGNLVLLGLSHWADGPAFSPPAIDAGRARRAAAAHGGGGWRLAAPPRLEYVPFADVPPAETYGFRLAWVVEGRITGSLGTFEALVDGGTGELLAFEDRNQYAFPTRIVGGVYPLSNDGRPPDGIEQPGYPMPFADVRLPGGTTVFTNSSGVAGCVVPPGPRPGLPPLLTMETRLAGPYVRMSDVCGPIVERFPAHSRRPSDLGSGPGTDCAVPPGHSAGDTHAARTSFYELNRMTEQARGYLPGNAWLQTPLVANVNLNATCGASWNGVSLNFLRAGSCRNAGEVAGVIDHEWGHGMDDNGADPTVSNPAEGIADVHSVLRQNESCIGRGFLPGNCNGYGDPCTACTGVRDVDWAQHASGQPHDVAWVQAACPGGTSVCGRLVHCAGLVVAEAVWDLHARDLPAQSGLDANSALELATRLTYLGSGLVGLWYQCTPPSGGCGAQGGYMGFLSADDDNGNLLDGTPHAAAIFAAFNRHQIACATPPPVNSGCAGGPSTAPVVTATHQDQRVTLSWTAVPGATRYAVYRADGVRGCETGKVKLGETTGTAFTDPGLLNGFSYFYTVLPMSANSSCLGPMSACQPAVPAGPGMCAP